ncbi:MAG: hypothetical protein L6Q72_16705, partial [Burkholderiaceae bacterium]|nr:hypothetical protein [Burkholderiaceae bacterium]
MTRDGVLSLLALGLALAFSVVVGGFLGFSTNPDRTAAFDAAHMELAKSGASGTIEELQRRQLELAQKHPGFNSPNPPAPVAILKWHPLLLGAFSVVLLCAFRPSWRWATAVFDSAPVGIAIADAEGRFL